MHRTSKSIQNVILNPQQNYKGMVGIFLPKKQQIESNVSTIHYLSPEVRNSLTNTVIEIFKQLFCIVNSILGYIFHHYLTKNKLEQQVQILEKKPYKFWHNTIWNQIRTLCGKEKFNCWMNTNGKGFCTVLFCWETHPAGTLPSFSHHQFWVPSCCEAR